MNSAGTGSPSGSRAFTGFALALTLVLATIVVQEWTTANSNSDDDDFFELRNVTDAPVDLIGSSVWRCDQRGPHENTGRFEVG